MKIIVKTVGTLGLLGCAVMNSPFAMADDSGWYVGANIGQSRAKIADDRITAQLLSGGLVTTSISDNNRDLGYKIFGGYLINKNFAIEGGYFDLGEFGFRALTLPTGTLNGNIKLKGLNLDLVGILPFTEKFAAFGRVGVNYAQAKDSFSGTGSVSVLNPNPSKYDTNYKFGVGLQYALTESIGLRAEAERYRIDDAVGNKGDIDLLSLGLVYRFGQKTPTPEPIAESPAPEPVATAPAPEPVAAAPEPVVVVPPPRPRAESKKQVFSADSSAGSLFDFDKSTLKPAGKEALDVFAADLKGADFDDITVTGHTDRIGSHAYNMKLSTRRAEAVKAYLVESAGLPADKITAKGVDGSQPVTKPGKCKGKKATKKLIACLAPDRRVEVEVTATRTSN
jgi:OmpA-OmpF porin, OOP family